MSETHDSPSAMSDTAAARLAALRNDYVSAQLRGDRRRALQLVLSALQTGRGVHDVQQHVIAEAQREVGRLWEQNSISVAEEHMATAISQMALAHLYDHADRAPDIGKRIWVACVEGELHDFPARLVADTLDLAGFDVKYLGANVPTAGLLSMLARERPDLLALSATMSFNLTALRAAVSAVRAVHPRLPIAIGGGACTPALGAAEGLAEICVRDATALVAAARSVLGVGVS